MEENTKTVTEAEEKESVSKNFIEREIEKDLACLLYTSSLSPIIGLIFAWLFSVIWIYPQNAMDAFGVWLGGMGAVGVFVFIFLNRALIPLGLHQVLNAYILFEMGSYTNAAGEVVHGEIPRFMAGDPTAGWFWIGRSGSGAFRFQTGNL